MAVTAVLVMTEVRRAQPSELSFFVSLCSVLCLLSLIQTIYIYIYLFIYVCVHVQIVTPPRLHIFPFTPCFLKDSKCNFTLLVLRKNIFSCEQPLCNTAEQSMMKNILSTIKLWSEKYFKYQFTCDEYTFVTHLIVSYIIHESRKWSR